MKKISYLIPMSLVLGINFQAVQAADPVIPFETLKIRLANIGLNDVGAEAVRTAMIDVLGEPGSLVCRSFYPDPGDTAVGFGASASGSVKGFYRKYNYTSSQGTVTPGELGTNGSVTFEVTGETNYYGTCPGGNYTIKYLDDTMATLVAAGMTENHWPILVEGLFAEMAATPGAQIHVDDFMRFRLSPTTGNISMSGTDYKMDYITD